MPAGAKQSPGRENLACFSSTNLAQSSQIEKSKRRASARPPPNGKK